MEGTSAALLGAVRGAAIRRRAPRLGGLLLRPALRGLRRRARPAGAGRRVPARPAAARRGPHGSFGRAASRARSRWPRAACAWTWRAGRTSASPRRALSGARRPQRPLRCPTSHDARPGPRADPRAPGRRAGARPCPHHRGDPLPERPHADSLDLYTLVQELEDTYGVKMSDEQAAGIQTVGAAVDFVLAQPKSAAAGGVADREPDPDPARAARPAGAAAGRARPAGGDPRVLGPGARRRVRAARLPGRLRARPRGHDAPVSAAGELRRGAADEGPRAGGVGPLVPGGGGAAGHAGAAARGGAAELAGPATERSRRPSGRSPR